MRRAILVLAVCSVAACSNRGRPQSEPEPRAESALRVENQNFLDVTVYALRGGQRVRLGVVPGLSSQVFFLPPNLVSLGTELQLLADPIGSNATAVSQTIYVRPGDVVQFIIPSRIP